MKYGKKRKQKKPKVEFISPFESLKGNVGGRPPKYDNEDDLRADITAYFERCIKTSTLANKAGLCVFLHISRDTYSEYRKRFPDTIKTADKYIEDAWVQRLKYQGATGPIFYLKNAFRNEYKDRIENSVDHSGSVIYLPPPPEPKKKK